MENKELYNILVKNIKNELSDFAQVQRNLKKSRKLEFRPKDKSLQSICDEINSNRLTISVLLYYYRWIRHGLKYWTNYNVKDFWEYQNPYIISNNHIGGFLDTNRYQTVRWYNNKTLEDYVKDQFYNHFSALINKYKIELTQEEKDNFIKYLYKNS